MEVGIAGLIFFFTRIRCDVYSNLCGYDSDCAPLHICALMWNIKPRVADCSALRVIKGTRVICQDISDIYVSFGKKKDVNHSWV